MKKRSFVMFLSTIIVSLYSLHITYNESCSNSEMSSLLLENIEALAAGEGGTDGGEFEVSKIRCIDVGALDCPITHEKVKYVLEGYNL